MKMHENAVKRNEKHPFKGAQERHGALHPASEASVAVIGLSARGGAARGVHGDVEVAVRHAGASAMPRKGP